MVDKDKIGANYFLVVLRIACRDDDDDPRRWPFDDLLAAPDDPNARFVYYATGAKEDRS